MRLRQDLRRCGWQLVRQEIALHTAWLFPALARVDDDARARLLRLGIGDVFGNQTSLREVEVRALRIAAQATMLPRMRNIER